MSQSFTFSACFTLFDFIPDPDVSLFPCFFFVVPMMPLTGKERRKYLAALKEKNALGEHIASDPAGLLLQKRKKDQGAVGETPGGNASGSNKGVVDDVIDLAASPLRKKTWTIRKDAGKDSQLEKDIVAEVDAA